MNRKLGMKICYTSLMTFLLVISMCFFGPGLLTAHADDTAQVSLEQTDPDGKNDSGHTDVVELDQIVVTATQTGRAVAELPQSVTVMDSEMVNDSGSANITDAFKSLPGVAVQDFNASGSGNQIFIRGYDMDRLSNSLDFQLEGVSVHSNASWGNHLLNSIPRSAVSKIELLKGSGTAMYGSRGTVGVVNTFLKRPFGPPAGEASVSYGSYNQVYTDVAGSFSSENAAVTIAGNFGSGDSYHDHQSFENNSVVLAPTFLLGDHTTVETTLLHGERNVSNPMYTFLSDAQMAVNRQENYDRGTLESQVTFLGGNVTHEFNDTTTWVTKGGFHREIEDQDFSGDGSGNSFVENGYHTRMPTDNYDLRTYLNLSDIGTRGSTFTVGGHYHYETSEQYQKMAAMPTRDTEARVNNYALFAQYEWQVLDPLTVSLGVRGDLYVTDMDDHLASGKSYDGKEEWAVSPRIGASWEVIRNLNLYTTFAKGFRVPTPYELGVENSLNPEDSLNYEVGIKARPQEFWETVLAFYYNDYSNMISSYHVHDSATNMVHFKYANSGSVVFQGIEWANYFNFGYGFSGYGNVLLDDSHHEDWKSGPDASTSYDRSGSNTLYTPHVQFKLGVKYKKDGWDIGFDAGYYDKYYSDYNDTHEMDAYLNVDTHVSYTYKMVTLTLFVNNLLDEEYYAYGWRGRQFPAPSRNFMLMLRVDI